MLGTMEEDEWLLESEACPECGGALDADAAAGSSSPSEILRFAQCGYTAVVDPFA